LREITVVPGFLGGNCCATKTVPSQQKFDSDMDHLSHDLAAALPQCQSSDPPKVLKLLEEDAKKILLHFFYVKKDGFYHFFGIGSKMAIATRR
jgi:hypothetical protein